jgi:hypothetical protein
MDNATLPPPPAAYEPPLNGRCGVEIQSHPDLSTNHLPYASSALAKIDGGIRHIVKTESGVTVVLRMTPAYVKDLIVRLQSFI